MSDSRNIITNMEKGKNTIRCALLSSIHNTVLFCRRCRALMLDLCNQQKFFFCESAMLKEELVFQVSTCINKKLISLSYALRASLVLNLLLCLKIR